ncbi:MAG: SDR family oxidoreductase [Flavobacteriales bacterium]|nr:SDR family oxidoreductase [Flavobacteriales bacterium]
MNNKTAFVTGATSGIGAAFARKLASQGYDLILTGRRKEKLDVLAKSLSTRYQVNVEAIIAELTNKEDLNFLTHKIKEISNLNLLINNAGFGRRGHFASGEFDIYEDMINAHCYAVMKLTYTAIPRLLESNNAAIINVSSLGGLFPYRDNTVYCATKAFISLFSESLNLELKDKGIRVQALCPGFTKTDFHKKLNEDIKSLAKRRGRLWKIISSDDVVEMSLTALSKNKPLCIPGFFNRLIVRWLTLRRLPWII